MRKSRLPLEERMAYGMSVVRSEQRIFITGMRDHKFKSIKDLLVKLFERGHNTSLESGNTQITGRARSLRDIFRLVWWYFPDADPKDILTALVSLQNIVNSHCTFVRKVVHSRGYSGLYPLTAPSGIPYVRYNEMFEYFKVKL